MSELANDNSTPRTRLAKAKRWVLKIGSSLLTRQGTTLDRTMIRSLSQQIARLRQEGKEVVLVSSGAVAAGVARLGWNERPSSVNELQAAAAIGQSGLIQAYEEALHDYQLIPAQILLDHDDIANRERYLNARMALHTLLGLGVVPIINENDTVVTEEIRFGDNDTLAAMVANLIDAQVLCILTDQLGMYDKNPAKFDDALLLNQVDVDAANLDSMASGGGKFGRGGMSTKVQAARLAAQSGAQTVVIGGNLPDAFSKLLLGDKVGTIFTSSRENKSARKQWLVGQRRSRGSLIVDEGAVRAILHGGNSLLPVGVTHVGGIFSRGDLVDIFSENKELIARGLSSYPSSDAKLLCGKSSNEIYEILGYRHLDALVHRDNLVLV